MIACVDSKLSGGCGPCVDICPDVFELNEDGLAVVNLGEIPEEFHEACRKLRIVALLKQSQ